MESQVIEISAALYLTSAKFKASLIYPKTSIYRLSCNTRLATALSNIPLLGKMEMFYAVKTGRLSLRLYTWIGATIDIVSKSTTGIVLDMN